MTLVQTYLAAGLLFASGYAAYSAHLGTLRLHDITADPLATIGVWLVCVLFWPFVVVGLWLEHRQR